MTQLGNFVTLLVTLWRICLTALMSLNYLHSICRESCCCVSLRVLVLLVLAGWRPALADPVTGARTRAIGDIFADDHVIDAALGIHQRAMAMSPQERFTFLAQWVLPNDVHSSLRLTLAFSPTYPAQADDDPPVADGRRIASGGEIVCPALDLIETARQLNQLAVIRNAVEAIQPRNRLEKKQMFAFRCLIELAANNVDGALVACDAFLSLTNPSDPKNSQYRNDELLVMLKASTTPELHEMLAEYVRRVLVPERWPTYSDAWSRQFAKFAFRITPAMIEDQIRKTENELPQIVESPEFWTPVTFPLAARRGAGMPAAEWLFTRSQVINVANHGDDAVYFKIPLLGDLDVEADTTVSDWREAEMIVGARWVSSSHQADLCSTGTVRRKIGDFK